MTPFLIGIDLGTTNSAVAFVDTRRRSARIELFPVPQLVEPSVVEPRPVLPSFLYFGEPHEVESGALALPWDPRPEAVAGVLARERGALATARQVASAKSWLAHPGVDRRAPILPWGSDSGPRISPVNASARYLMHMRDAWNATVARGNDSLRFERQAVVLTVPASFDEEARELTVEAARDAHLSDVRLLEEPIAAFYAWIAEHRRSAASELHSTDDEQIALVCDVGGGTTDFSLIRVRVESGAPAFERVAIGDHLLLGGDNVDLALATLIERRMLESHPGARLAITQRSALRRLCSAAKERMLGPDPPDHMPITVLGAGRAVVGSTITSDLSREDVERTLESFLPRSRPDEAATARDRRAGLRELGLPYETDPAITKHLAAFLVRACAGIGVDHPAVAAPTGRPMVRPNLVLFNGGFFSPPGARDRVTETLAAWFGAAPRVLTTNNLEAAVALGAAAYARLRAGIGPSLSLVKAGSGRTYYVGLRGTASTRVSTPSLGAGRAIQAVSVVARGTEEGTETHLEHQFTVATNQPISFALYSSTTRSDRAGDIVSLSTGDDRREHAPLVTVLRYGRKSRQVELPVRLSAAFTEVGTLELWCESQVTDHRWRLQFQLRDATGEDEVEDEPEAADAVIADGTITASAQAIRSVFEGTGELQPENLVAHLEQTMGYAKTSWPLGVIRQLADALIAISAGRQRSAALEARWLNLFGFCVRPGFGGAKDPWRIGEARKVYVAGLAFPGAIQNRVEWLVLWQRAAGGFSPGQQRELGQRIMGELGLAGKKAARLNPQIERESWRLLASLERLDAPTRLKIGDELIRRVRRDDSAAFLWAIGRLGAREPLYGPLSSVVPPEDAARWLEALVSLRRSSPDLAAAIVQIGALTGDPLRDVDQGARDRARARLLEAGIDESALRPLHEVVRTSMVEANRVFGEPLPDGLRLEETSAR